MSMRKIYNSKINEFSIQFYLFSIVFFFIINVCSLFSFNSAYQFSKIFTLSFVIILIIRSFRKNGIISIYSLFISFCLFFLYLRIFFDLIGYKSLANYTFGTHRTWSDKILFSFLNYSFLYLLTIDFFYYMEKPKRIHFVGVIQNNTSKRIIYCFFLLFTLIFLYKCYLDIQAIHKLGYTSTVSNVRINYPIWTVGAGTFFYIFFYLLLMHKLSKKETVGVFIIYAIVSLLSGLKGARAAFFVPIIFSLFYLSEKKYIKVTFPKLIILIIVAMSLIFLITFSRGEDLSYVESLKDIFCYVFYNQTQTFNVPIFYLEYKDICKEHRFIPFIFSDVLHYYIATLPSGGSTINNFTGLPNGMGLGNSLFLELLDLPLILAFFACFCIAKAIKFVQYNFLRNRKLLPLFCCFVSSAFYMPRNTLFSFLDPSSVIYLIASNVFLIIFLFFAKYSFNAGTQKNE